MSVQTITVLVNLPESLIKLLYKLKGGTASQHIASALQEFVDHPLSRPTRKFWQGLKKDLKVKLPSSLYQTLQERHPRISWQDVISAYLRRHRLKRPYARRVVAKAG